jgi:hypothetical protein
MKGKGISWMLLTVIVACMGCGQAKQRSPEGANTVADNANTPEAAYRRFMLANLTGDEQAIRPLIVDHEDADILWQGAFPKDVAALLAEQYRKMEITRVTLPGQDGESDRVLLQSSASPIPLTVVKSGGKWKLDASPIIKVRKAVLKTS